MRYFLVMVVFIWLLGAGLHAQELPMLFPSNITAYDIDGGLPISCAHSGLMDQKGRLWVNPCFNQEEHRTVNFYHFDGTGASVINWDELPEEDLGQAAMVDMMETGNIYGFFRNSPYFFVFEPDSHQTTFGSLPSNEVDIFHMLYHPQQGLILVGLSDTAMLIYRSTQEGPQLIHKFPLKSPYLEVEFVRYTMALSATDLWFFEKSLQDVEDLNAYPSSFGNLIQLRLDDQKISRYSLKDFFGKNVPVPHFKSSTERMEIDHQGNLILFLTPWVRYFTINPETKQVQDLDIFGSEKIEEIWYLENMLINKDEAGNLLFFYQDRNQVYHAILRDTSGNTYDYSAIFNTCIKASRFQHGFIYHLWSKDFRRQAHVFMNGGVAIVDLTLADAIEVFLKSKPTRAISELNKDQFLVVQEGGSQGAVIYTEMNKQHPFDFDCGSFSVESTYYYANFRKDKKGIVWFPFKNRFVGIDSLEKCRFIEVGFRFDKFTFINESTIALVGRENELLYLDIETQELTPFTSKGQALKFSGQVNEILLTEDHTLWVATLKGLWHIDLKTSQVRHLGLADGFKDQRIMCLHKADGKLWVGTYGNGLHIYDLESQTVKVVDKNSGLSNNTVIGILVDEEGIRWLSTYHGITLVDAEGSVLTQIYQEDGLSTNEFNRYSYYKDSQGHLFFGSIAGLNRIDPKAAKEQLFRADEVKIYLTGLSYYNTDKESDHFEQFHSEKMERLSLPAAQRYLKIRYALSSKVKPTENRFAYRLEGLKKGEATDWVYLGTQTELNLPNLPVGKYNIVIKGSDYRGNWTASPIVIPVLVQEFFYRQYWFYGLCLALLLVLILAWIYRQRVIRLKLERQVKERTAEILKTRDQLIVQEKLASLGQLTAGIAHEIKNPLNFVNNFSEGSLELLIELWEAIERRKDAFSETELHDIQYLIEDLRQNATDIRDNGLRADRIVKSMMDHARGTQTERQFLNINTLVDDNVNLAYHGFRALDPSFNVHFEKAFDESIPLVSVYPQDFGRVLLNILNNACYAVSQKQKISSNGYAPTLWVKTVKVENGVEIRIRDNGPGMSQQLQQKIFTPFFTTKETGSGNTGLGLSISYDIIVQRHNGSLHVQSKEGEFAEFIIGLPL